MAMNASHFKDHESIQFRKRLSSLNCHDLHQYFTGFHQVYRDLLAKRDELEVNHFVYQERLLCLHKSVKELKTDIAGLRSNFFSRIQEYRALKQRTLQQISEAAPDLQGKFEQLSKKQHNLESLKFFKHFNVLRDQILGCLRAGKFAALTKNYCELFSHCNQSLFKPTFDPWEKSGQASDDDHRAKFCSLNQFLLMELRNALVRLYSQIRFPFEESVDYRSLTRELGQSLDILRCYYTVKFSAIHSSLPISSKGTHSETTSAVAFNATVSVVLDEFVKRFRYHFYGDDKSTNQPAKPEWFFAQLSSWLANNCIYFEQFVSSVYPQHNKPCLLTGDDVRSVDLDICCYSFDSNNSETSFYSSTARDQFLECLVGLAADKVQELVGLPGFIEDSRLLSHLIDETVIFERELQEVYGYDSPDSTTNNIDVRNRQHREHHCRRPKEHVITALYNNNNNANSHQQGALDVWVRLERDTVSAAVDALLAERNAFEPRYKEAADVDRYLVPNFADLFVVLMQSMFERYRAIPDSHLQCRFLKLQLVIVDEFRSRIVQLLVDCFGDGTGAVGASGAGQGTVPHPVFLTICSSFPGGSKKSQRRNYRDQKLVAGPASPAVGPLLNALWYMALVLDEWSASPNFFQLEEEPPYGLPDDEADSSAPHHDPVRGTFDDSAALYRHVWRQRIRHICVDLFSVALRASLSRYLQEPWHSWMIGPIDRRDTSHSMPDPTSTRRLVAPGHASQQQHQPMDVTPSLVPGLHKLAALLDWMNSELAPDCLPTVHRLANHAVWTVLDEELILRPGAQFNCSGASQILFDISNGLIPVLNSRWYANTARTASTNKSGDSTNNDNTPAQAAPLPSSSPLETLSSSSMLSIDSHFLMVLAEDEKCVAVLTAIRAFALPGFSSGTN